ncbi:MAG: DUF1178 family protein, partial [Pikeienuella sp.]
PGRNLIRYQWQCETDHAFEAWFGSAAAYDEQASHGLVSCAVCGATRIEKALMAPAVPKKGAKTNEEEPAQPMLSTPVPAPIAEKLAALRREIEKNSDYVGRRFASEARAMHLGETEHRQIHGEATGEEAKALIEEGVPVAPLPFAIRRDD